MKKETASKITNPWEGYPASINEENKHLFPKEIREAFDFIDENKSLFPERYFRKQRVMIKQKVKGLWEQNPSRPIKEVIEIIMKPLPSWLPAARIIEITKLIIKEWEQLHKEEIFA
jgi:hypothetical protein